MHITLVDVESSNIAQVGYHAPSRTLTVVFRSGAVYQYFAVEQETYDALLAADSKGRYLNSAIKGHYHYERCA